ASDVTYPPVFYRKLKDDLASILVNIVAPETTADNIRLKVTDLSFAQQQLLSFYAPRFEQAIECCHVVNGKSAAAVYVFVYCVKAVHQYVSLQSPSVQTYCFFALLSCWIGNFLF